MKAISTLCITSSFLLFSITSNAAVYSLSGTMDASQAGTNGGFGGGSSPANGTISGTYDDVSNLLNYNISWSGFTSTITNMHFHAAAPGSSGGVDLSIPSPWTSPVTGTNIALNATQESNLLAGNWYVNIHTSDFGGGEIRGQVNPSVVPEPSSTLLLSLGMIGFAVRRKRSN